MDAELQKLVDSYRAAVSTSPDPIVSKSVDFFGQYPTNQSINYPLLVDSKLDTSKYRVPANGGKALKAKESFLDELEKTLPTYTAPLDPEMQKIVNQVKSAPPDKTLTQKISESLPKPHKLFDWAGSLLTPAKVVDFPDQPTREFSRTINTKVGKFEGSGGTTSMSHPIFFSPIHTPQSWKIGEKAPKGDDFPLDPEISKLVTEYKQKTITPLLDPDELPQGYLSRYERDVATIAHPLVGAVQSLTRLATRIAPRLRKILPT